MKIKIKIKIKILLFMLLASTAQAKTKTITRLPDSMIMPCVKEIPITSLTRAIIPMMPWRSANLTFPFELGSENTHYSLSGDKIWRYDKALKGNNIVLISFKGFDKNKNWGAVNDLTIATKGFVFSLALHAVRNPKAHCSNIIFTLSDEQKLAMEEAEKKNFLESIKREHEEKLAVLDNAAQQKALLLVASLANGDPEKERIKEESVVTFANGDEAIVYVKAIKGYGNFSTLTFDIENESDELALYIESIEIKKEGSTTMVPGAIEFPPKIVANTQAELVFVTLEHLTETNMALQVKTNIGMIEVSW